MILRVLMFSEYLERLFGELEKHVELNTKPDLADPKPPTPASTGPDTELQETYQGRDVGKKKLFF